MKLINLFIFITCLYLVNAQCERDTEIICYWGSWSIYRVEDGLFTTENINTDICTTIVYAFAGLDLNLHMSSLNTDGDIAKAGFKNFTSLKEKNPCLTTILAIGGWNEGSRKYSVLASSEEHRKKFAYSVLTFLAFYGFDGLDLDWEYPTTRGGISDDKGNFIQLLKELRTLFTPYGLKLSIAVSIDESLINVGYDVQELINLVDTVNLMAYDYISSDSKVTGLSSPLSKIKITVNKWLDAGLPAKKLILGIPAYAKNFVLDDSSKNGIGAPVANIGIPGQYTKEDGLLAYYEVLPILSDYSDIIQSFSIDDTNYATYNTEWFTYDNEKTVSSKTIFAMDSKLGGVMLWALELDDFNGLYGVEYPLLNAIKNSISQYKSQKIENSS